MSEEELKIKLDRWFSRNWDHYCSEVRKNIANGQMSQHADDLSVLIYEEFMKKPHAQKLQMYQDNKILNWMLRAASFQIKSGSSPFYRLHRKHSVKHIPSYFAENEGKAITKEGEWNNDDAWLCVKEAMTEDNIGWYYSKLLDMKFIQQMTYTDMCEKYGFAINTLKKDIKRALEAAKQHCNHL